jgi:hypothetical protein
MTRTSRDGAPPSLALFIPVDSPLTVGQEFEVHAITVFQGLIFFQIVEDEGHHPLWVPAWMCKTVAGKMPGDWVANLVDEGHLVIGPPFLARDLQSYVEMVERNPEQIARFRQRLEAIHASLPRVGED